MGQHPDKSNFDKVSLAGSLIAFGIVYGDIGTSPLYALGAIFGDKHVSPELALGALSAVFWTLTLQTTIKYVIITLRADNNGEGGIFSLFALVRRYYKWTLFPAIIGGGFLLADGIITPPISVSSAIEGLKAINPEINTVPIVIAILVMLFTIQQFGTNFIGKFFGPVMVFWFTTIGVFGLLEAIKAPGVLAAVNPMYAYKMLAEYPGGFWLLGGVFLCTTGAEALYSDIGHCGRGNIRATWGYVKLCLLLSYAGQTAFVLENPGIQFDVIKPFFRIVPEGLELPTIILATLATVIASQALISGSFTLVGEAMRLGVWPKLKVIYPSTFKGQLYVPFINWFLMFGTIGVVLYFEESSNMEAAYGLAVTLTMMMSTFLIAAYLTIRRTPMVLVVAITSIFFIIEASFLIANSIKFQEGGFISMIMGGLLIYVMYAWYRARQIKQKFIDFESLNTYLPKLEELSNDMEVPRYSTHLVYMTASGSSNYIESRIIYSIFKRGPKRAEVFWFIHVNVVDEPYTMKYSVEHKAEHDVIWVTFNLGFRIEPRVGLFFRLVVEDLVRNGEVNIDSPYQSVGKNKMSADFRFVLMKYFLSYENDLDWDERLLMGSYFVFDQFSLTDSELFGLDSSNLTIEKIPLIISPVSNFSLIREEPKGH